MLRPMARQRRIARSSTIPLLKLSYISNSSFWLIIARMTTILGFFVSSRYGRERRIIEKKGERTAAAIGCDFCCAGHSGRAFS